MSDLNSLLSVSWTILQILLGLGFVIFVHELGHFAVAKLCGVKCEKFYLGFDIGGWKLCKFRYGETEYGIGILPLGGYVKMLGQDDNPSKLKEEIERSKMQPDSPTASTADPSNTASQKSATASNEEKPCEPAVDLEHAQEALFNPRSYLAKSVPQRMAIISAGVIMNVIFAFVMAVIAYAIGVEQMKCTVGDTFPGEAAWRADLQPGDRILEITGNKIRRFQDLQKYVQLGDIQNGVPMLIERPTEEKPRELLVHPDEINLAPSIGILNATTTTLVKDPSGQEPPCYPLSTASKAKPALVGGDQIVSINGETISDFRQLHAYLGNHPEKPLDITLKSTTLGKDGTPESTTLHMAKVPPQPMRTLGLVMKMGAISAIQEGSPAEKAGIRVGDRILKIDGQAPEDPQRLPEQFRDTAGKSFVVTLERDGKPLEVSLVARKADSFWTSRVIALSSVGVKEKSFPVAIPQLGIAYRVQNVVEQVVPDSPAAKAGIRPGSTIEKATLVPPDSAVLKKDSLEQKSIDFSFDAKNETWPLFFLSMQVVHPKTTVELKLKDQKQVVKLEPKEAQDWFNPDRGLILKPDTFFQKAENFGEAIQFGASETKDALLMVVKVLQKVQSGQVSPKAFGGPITIVRAAYQSAERGMATLLLFLTLLSANLAVLNVLPIPMLDGGHLVFLAYEGIRGKPADERVQIGLSLIGLALLLALMIFVCGLDIHRLIFR